MTADRPAQLPLFDTPDYDAVLAAVTARLADTEHWVGADIVCWRPVEDVPGAESAGL